MSDISVLVVDDHAIFAEALESLLRREPDMRPVWIAHALPEARTLLAHHLPDVVVLDLVLGDGSGLELARYAREHSPHSRLLMLTAVTSTERVVAALRSGVCGWLPKTVDSGELVQVIRGVARGAAQLAPELLGAVLPELIREPGAVQPNPLTTLTVREREVLQCLVDGLTRAQIAGRLFLSANTVRTHTQNLLAKFGVHSALEAVAVGLRHGLVPLPSPLPSPLPLPTPPLTWREPATEVPLQRPRPVPMRRPPLGGLPQNS